MKSITVSEFITTIFANTSEHENVLCCVSAGLSPGFPVSVATAEKRLKRATKANAFFSTATATASPEGELRNKLAYFEAQYCVVLDDIGTGEGAKISPEDLPKELREEASWVIESSTGNFQYGYILDEPIRDIEVARAFTRLVYAAGVSDSGGALCNKLVRLPAGQNAKAKYRDEDGNYPDVTLVEWRPEERWHPADLMELAGCAVSWEDLLVDVEAAIQRDPRRGEGATAYRKQIEYSMRGVVDEVLEWLEKRGDVINQGENFWDVTCPWHGSHNDGKGSTPGSSDACAGYSPLGHGDQPERRGFNCFHDSCSGDSYKGAREFLEWVVAQGGPGAPIVDPIAKDVARWSFEAQGSTWVDMQDDAPSVPDRGFKNLMAEKVVVPRQTPGGTIGWAQIKKYDMMLSHPGLVRFTGTTYNPTLAPVVNMGGALITNQCRLPFYSSGEPDTAKVEPLLDFFKYLLPGREGEDYEWFMSHLAMKARDLTYRGNAVYMSTPVHGTGRGTLSKILRLLLGEDNVGAPSMNELLKGIRGDDKNASLRRLAIVVPEAAEAATKGQHLNHGQFEVLKQFCDPFPVLMEYDAKYGAKWAELNYSMVIICSNTDDAIRREAGDRRFRHMKNTTEKRKPEYFTKFHALLDAGGWQEPLWRWLLARDVSDFKVGVAANDFDLEQEENLLLSMTPIDRCVYFALEYCETACGGAVLTRDIIKALNLMPEQVRTFESMIGYDWPSLAKRRIASETVGIPRELKIPKVKYDGNSVAFRHTTGVAGHATMRQVKQSKDATRLRDAWVQGSINDMATHIEQRLREFDL